MPTPCDPIDGSPPGSPVPGILQARTLEWGAIAFSNMKVKSASEGAQSCPTLSDPMDCSPPGSSVCGIFQARACLEVLVILQVVSLVTLPPSMGKPCWLSQLRTSPVINGLRPVLQLMAVYPLPLPDPHPPFLSPLQTAVLINFLPASQILHPRESKYRL